MDWIVFDIEIAKTIEQVGGWDNTGDMGVAVACLWEMETRRMRVYGPDDVDELRKRVLAADRVTSFNGWGFDYPVLWGLSKERWKSNDVEIETLRGRLAKTTDDLLRRIWKALEQQPDAHVGRHVGYGLDAVARETIGVCKTGNGADAPKWYQAGLVQRVADYCAHDVAITRDLAEFVERYGYVVCKGQVIRMTKWSSI